MFVGIIATGSGGENDLLVMILLDLQWRFGRGVSSRLPALELTGG